MKVLSDLRYLFIDVKISSILPFRMELILMNPGVRFWMTSTALRAWPYICINLIGLRMLPAALSLELTTRIYESFFIQSGYLI
jgi:hypothetical protein